MWRCHFLAPDGLPPWSVAVRRWELDSMGLIDFDNARHVPGFEPLLYVVTAREHVKGNFYKWLFGHAYNEITNTSIAWNLVRTNRQERTPR